VTGICDNFLGVYGYHHGLIVEGHEGVSLPEGGIVQLLMCTILLGEPFYLLMTTMGCFQIVCSLDGNNIPNMSLASCFFTSSCSGLRPLQWCR
jgi:hypothetical protein